MPGTFGSLRKSRCKLQVLGGAVRLKNKRIVFVLLSLLVTRNYFVDSEMCYGA